MEPDFSMKFLLIRFLFSLRYAKGDDDDDSSVLHTDDESSVLHSGDDSEHERVHFHRAPNPVLHLLTMATGVTFTEEQPHRTMEQALAILTSDAVWASSTPPRR